MPVPLEQARRDFKRDHADLYAYIEARIASRELDRAGGDVSGVVDGHAAANHLWTAAGRWQTKWRNALDRQRATQ